MIRFALTLAMICVAAPAVAQDLSSPAAGGAAAPALDVLPEGINRFSGSLVGRVVRKDVETGTFVTTIDRVARVWQNNQAEQPKSIVGKTVAVDGVFGKWLDVLLLVKEGETLEFEARHAGGPRLTFIGEAMRKVPPVQPGDYPELPEEFRGFEGVVTGKIVKKDEEMLELMLEVEKVDSVAEKSQARQPERIVGQRLIVAGFWQRRDAYHPLKVGDRIETGIRHITPRSDHVSVAGSIRKVDAAR